MDLKDIKNTDHNYSNIRKKKAVESTGKFLLPLEKTMSLSPVKEKAISQVKTINDLKKVISKVKIIGPEVTELKQLTKMNSQNKSLSTMTNADTKEQLKNYCRTCAGLKIPLVDIFGERGIQMRLNQQMKHLEEINEHESLSTQMCMDCICDLKMSYKFFLQIKKAEVKLKSIHASLSAASNAAKVEEKHFRLIETSKPAKKEEVISIEKEIILTPEKSIEKSPVKEQVTHDVIEKSPVKEQVTHDIIEKSPVKEQVTHDIIENVADVSTEAVRENKDEATDHHSDQESIEEFDPDDTNYEPEETFGDNNKGENSLLSESEQNNQSFYEYNQSMNAFFKTESVSITSTSGDEMQAESFIQDKKLADKEIFEDNQFTEPSTGTIKSPNILKRKAPSLSRDSIESVNTNDSTDSLSSKSIKDSKIQKLMVQNPVSISSSDEQGIMYVTVKGSKPNELLLVKVKKMDKQGSSNNENWEEVQTAGKNLCDVKPMEKVIKVLINDPNKGNREAAIEEQIEQYKKKREKILGGSAGLPNALKFEDGAVRFVNPINSCSDMIVTPTDQVRIKTEPSSGGEEEKAKISSRDSTSEVRSLEYKERLVKLEKIKKQWLDAKKKKEALQQELNDSYSEGNLERLSRILGGPDKSIQEFQEYLKQRKIVITKLKDEVLVSMFEVRNSSQGKPTFSDTEYVPIDSTGEVNVLECDYCIETFTSHENLEEHSRTHDYKILYFCEDCGEEFATNKAKRLHNVTCLKKLICKHCDFMLESKGKKRQHEQKHCDALNGQLCDVCGEKFKHQGTLDQHIKMQHMSWEKIFECPKCPKKFAFKQKLSFHLKTVHTTMRAFLCEDCGADFKNPASLRHHRIRKHQPTGNKKECPVCHKLVPFYSLSKHMYTHKAYSIQCPHCDKMFKNSSTLKQHVRIHEDQRQYRCDTCGVGFNRRDGLRLHMRVHQKSNSRALKECSCQICSEKFPNHSMLVIHRNRVHKDGKQYTCHICNRSMLSTRSLEWHMSHIHNETPPGKNTEENSEPIEKKRVACSHCNKTFKTEMILRTHIKNTHMEKNPVKCLDCEFTFTSEVRLRHHMMVAHNRLEGTLTCPHCPKRFVNQLRLKTHMISHSTDRPYRCEECGFHLKTKIQLTKHIQNRHSEERPLQCKYCPWKCKQVSALVCHQRTHTNERPYSCKVCKQRFKYLGDKNKHERRHEILGGSGFKRIVAGRTPKTPKLRIGGETSNSDDQEIHQTIEGEQEQEYEAIEGELDEENYEEHIVNYDEEGIIKYEDQIEEEYEEQIYGEGQEYEETSREASEAAEVIMNMEDVYTEEVHADSINTAEILTDEMISDEILQAGAVLHLHQPDENGKFQVIPVMISLADNNDPEGEVNLATASIMLND